jgi:DNA-binding IclR family transcriptional regulator
MSSITEELAWLDQIAADPRITPGAFKIAYVIVRHLNWRSREAWPSTLTIADRAGISERSVRRHIHELEHGGYVVVTRRAGSSSKYQMAPSAKNMPRYHLTTLTPVQPLPNLPR